jgi:Circularly permutated YpsA SLOG family
VLDRVISGGQTGADQAGWRAARASGIVTGGWMSEGFLTKDGPRPDFEEMFGAVEIILVEDTFIELLRSGLRGDVRGRGDGGGRLRRADPGQGPRLGRDDLVRRPDSPGGRTTLRACTGFGKPVYLVIEGLTQPSEVAAWIEAEDVRVLNVAGNRESTEPGLGERVERFLIAVFDLVAGR